MSEKGIHPVAASDSHSAPKRICLIRPSALGDVCRTVPVLVSLRRAFPEAEIDWVVQDTYAPAVAAHPDLTNVIEFPRHDFARAAKSPEALRRLFNWLRSLKQTSYDIVYDCQGLARSGFFAWCSRAPKRVGFRDAREGGFFGYTHRYDISSSLHTVDRMLGLVEADGIASIPDMRLYVSPDDETGWERLGASVGVSRNTRYAVLAPTSRWKSKQWPPDRFAELIPALIERGFEKVIFVGGENERSQCENLLEISRTNSAVVDLVGGTTVGTLMAAIRHADLVVANDSAPLHMAVGFKRLFLALFGPTDVSRVGPYKGERWVLQATSPNENLHHKNEKLGSSIMERISVQSVIGKLDELLSENPLECL